MRSFFLLIFTLITSLTSGQSLFESYSKGNNESLLSLSGFIRSAHYFGKGDQSALHFPTSYSDMSLQLKIGDGYHFRGYSDLRYRYGSEFDSKIGKLDLREAWVGVYGARIGFEAGKKIIKWGRTDFFNPLGVITPRNDLIRSPDPGDRDLSNIVVSAFLRPSEKISFTLFMLPQYQPSVLPLTVMRLPEYIEFINYDANISSRTGITYGIRNDFQFNRIDASLYWFDGYSNLPGIELGMLRIPDGSLNAPIISIEEHPYKIRMTGADIEIVQGRFGGRGAFTLSKPYSGSMQEEHLPFPEANWVTALEFSKGEVMITFEYAGKYLFDWKKMEQAASFPGADELNQLLLFPPELAENMIDQQIYSFNRLYNYQVEQQYNMLAFNITTTGERGRLKPDLSCIYNITTGEYTLLPALTFKPFDSVTAKMGLEYWYGKKGSVYNYLSNSLNSIWFGLRIDFN